MTLLDFIKLLLSFKKWLLALPLLVAVAVFALTMRLPKEYTSQALLYTGVVPTSDGTVNVQARVDVFVVNNAIDNIQTILLSRQVLEETSLHLLARHLRRKSKDSDSLEYSISKFLDEHLGELKNITALPSEEELYNLLVSKSHTPSMRWLLEDDLSIYCTDKIKDRLKVKRSGSSDLLELIFVTSEASVAKETLTFLIDSFTKRFKEIKKSEVGSMVEFFEREVAKAADRLSKRAEEMKQFQMKNKIINYYEQTHLVAIESEHLNGQYYDELMKLAASERAYADLRLKLGDPYQQALSSEEIIKAQQNISQLMTKRQLTSSSSEEYKSISESIAKAEDALKKSISQLYVDGRTEEGVSKKEVLRQWLDQFIALSESRARVLVMEQRKVKHEKEYDVYAPLGSMLHNYERQMDVAEREYLDLLHSLNQARLRQQSAETSTMLETVDQPSYPLKAEPSKRKLLAVIGWLGTFLMVVGIILFVEYFNSTLQSPERAEKKTGLAVLGTFAKDIQTKVGKLALSDFMLRTLINVAKPNRSSRKILIIALSDKIQALETGVQMANLFKDVLGEQVALAGACASLQNELTVLSVDELNANKYDTIVGIFPSIHHCTTEWRCLQNFKDVVLVVNGEHTWSSADQQAVSLVEKMIQQKPYLLLTGVEEIRMEHWLGELPKQRSRFRRIVKKIIQFQFS